MNNDLPGSDFGRFSIDDIYFVGQCMCCVAYVMMIAGFAGIIIRNVAHTSLETLHFPTFWIPESFAGAFLTAMLYCFGLGICKFMKGLDRNLRR